ncbi:MAG: stage II sporulation protein M [Anaerolineae bacterium]|nr:stage II sporulation protein M [Anaerolineae bacterium]
MTTDFVPSGQSLTAPPPRATAWQRWRATWQNALIITRREVSDSFHDWRIMAPIFILTLGFPALSQFGATLMLNFVTQYGAELIGERTIPFLLMIVGFFPISLSLVIALEMFVGEKERRSLEPLLATPLTNLELYIGKTLAAMIPPLAASYTGMAIYLGGLLLGDLAWRPPFMLIVQIILITTAQALLMVTGAVVVSSQTTSTRAANLLASFIIVPVSLLIILESIIMFGAPDAESPRGIFALWVILAGLVVGTALFMRIGTRIFNREELLASSLDVLNLRWIGRTFWRALRGEPGSGLLAWYREAVFPAARQLRKPALVVLLALVVAFAGGWGIGTWTEYQIPPGTVNSQAEVSGNLSSMFEMGAHPGTVLLAVWQNSRVLLAAAILALVSFGVLAVVLALLPFGILGWAFAQFIALGISPALFLAAVIPHSLVEIPAIFLATAAALRMGAVITERPPVGKTVGEMLLLAMADAIKIGVGLVLPLLVLAALVEVYITPAVVQAVLGG